MKVLILSSYHPYKNAGIIAKDILNCFRKIPNVQAKLLVKLWDFYSDNDIICVDSPLIHFSKWIHKKFKGFLRRIGVKTIKIFADSNYYFHNFDQTISFYKTSNIIDKIDFIPDAIVVLFMPDYLSFKNLYELNKITKAPILIYMMDMAPITGGCHYAWNCIGYTKTCGSCPCLISNDLNDQTYLNWKFKKNYIDLTDIFPIAASEWQWRQLNQSSLFNSKQKYKIMSPTDDELYKPNDVKSARNRFGLPLDKKIIFFGAVNIYEKRKGSKYLIEALQMLFNQISYELRNNIYVIIAGRKNPEIEKVIPFDTTFLGLLAPKDLALAYQSADVFVNTSIEDSGPTMINKAIMSGTPVVSFEMGVAPDLVKNGFTGYMAKLYDSTDLVTGLLNILTLTDLEYKRISDNCRKLALSACSQNKVGNDFLKLILTINNKSSN